MSFLVEEIIKKEHISKSSSIMNMILALVMFGNQLKKRDGECECDGDEEEPEERPPPLD